ncbi:disease resistance protein RRS1-like [Syzygium oleosum]|uniref:disease resistance protein RRS1-like n=1 Tax=Syzygium oleosum TaxID=219896 RepID=UPI0024BBBD2F|nr:disease resistance protein RRS1-like [Syzygium oleosum]
MWDGCNYHPHNSIHVLLQRSLIKIRDNKFWMHYLLRDLGTYIIWKEYPLGICRVWIQDEALELLQKKEEKWKSINEDVQALSLTSSCSCTFKPEQLAALPNLRFIRVKGINFFSNFDNHLSELRWLSWQVRQMTFQASNFHFSKLVVLDLSNSKIADGWGGRSQMKV